MGGANQIGLFGKIFGKIQMMPCVAFISYHM
jgi:hypothetical protein